jgi:hypothetical protein
MKNFEKIGTNLSGAFARYELGCAAMGDINQVSSSSDMISTFDRFGSLSKVIKMTLRAKKLPDLAHYILREEGSLNSPIVSASVVGFEAEVASDSKLLDASGKPLDTIRAVDFDFNSVSSYQNRVAHHLGLLLTAHRSNDGGSLQQLAIIPARKDAATSTLHNDLSRSLEGENNRLASRGAVLLTKEEPVRLIYKKAVSLTPGLVSNRSVDLNQVIPQMPVHIFDLSNYS